MPFTDFEILLDGTNPLRSDLVPGVGIDMGLVEDASERPSRNLVLSRHDCRERLQCPFAPEISSRTLRDSLFARPLKKPADSRRRLISRNPSGLSRPNLYLDTADCGRMRRNGWFEVQTRALRGDWPGPPPLCCPGWRYPDPGTGETNQSPSRPDGGGKWAFHIAIFPHASSNRYGIGRQVRARLAVLIQIQ